MTIRPSLAFALALGIALAAAALQTLAADAADVFPAEAKPLGPEVPAACNEIREAGQALYLKRDSGEIVKLEPRS